MGSNMAECHPVGFQWVVEAKERGAKVIHVDPRFTRTSAIADLHVPLRAGTDIAFLGGVINYIFEHEAWFDEYVKAYTNGPVIIKPEFRDTEDLAGFFSGFVEEDGYYDIASWGYDGTEEEAAAGKREQTADVSGEQAHGAHGIELTRGDPPRMDPEMRDPRCVFQLLRRHFSRYTPEMVERICGVPKEQFLEVARALAENSGRERTSAIVYSVGWTQHTVGVQYIRSAAVIQLLLGNMGRPGGGILALRGHANIQGSTDIPTLFNILPGYIPMPHPESHGNLDQFVSNMGPETGAWGSLRSYMVSLLKAWWGDAATEDNDFAFDFLPRINGDHSNYTTMNRMLDGKVKGFFVVGENPAVGSANGKLNRKAMAMLDWLVVRDFTEIETASFWKDGPEIETGELRTETIGTEVFLMPAAAHTEKDGSFTNTQRLLQWHHKAIDPPGSTRSELWFAYHLGRRLQALYDGSPARKDFAIRALTWDYPTKGAHAEPDAEAVLAEINGFTVADRKPLSGYTALKDDGSTACGCWIYSGCYADGVNQPARRKSREEQNWVAPEWGWAWPSNRRLMYNRASADPEGRPWSERKRYVWWDQDAKKWTGVDTPDFIADRPPSYRPPKDAHGTATISGIDPFIMQADGKGWLYAPSGLLDGPLPTHYEPQESVVRNVLYPQQTNPARLEWRRKDNPYHRAYEDPRFPFVLTVFRLTEHHTAGGMSRWLPWLSELQPEMFCEISPALARERGIEHAGWATIATARGAIKCRVLVTERLRPFRIDGRTIHQIGVPYHWGRVGLVTGDSANDLLPFVGDPNVNIPESKVLTADIIPGRQAATYRPANGVSDGAPRDLPGVGQRPPEPPRYKP